VKTLARLVVPLVASAVGLLVTTLIVDGVDLSAGGFIVAVVVFTLAQALLAPFLERLFERHASLLLAGAGLVTTFVALFIATRFGGGIHVRGGWRPWVEATAVVWLVTAVATIVLLRWVDRRSPENGS
jgi:hypothetical protein